VAPDPPTKAQAPFKMEKVGSFSYQTGPTHIAFSPAGDVWLATSRVDPAGVVLATAPLTGGFLDRTGVDSQGNFWASNNGGGLAKYSRDGRESWKKDFDFSDWFAFPFLVSKDDGVWIQANGIEKLDSQGNTLYKLEGLSTREFLEAPTGEVWLLGLGLTKLNHEGKVVGSYLHGYDPYDGEVDSMGNIWLLTFESGGHPGEILKVSPEGAIIATIAPRRLPGRVAVDRENNLWFTNGKDLEKYSPEGKLLGIVPFEQAVSCIAIDPTGRLWVGEQTSNPPYRGKVTTYSIQP
jgi:sugar lactone lactonase YvrE